MSRRRFNTSISAFPAHVQLPNLSAVSTVGAVQKDVYDTTTVTFSDSKTTDDWRTDIETILDMFVNGKDSGNVQLLKKTEPETDAFEVTDVSIAIDQVKKRMVVIRGYQQVHSLPLEKQNVNALIKYLEKYITKDMGLNLEDTVFRFFQ